MTINQIIKYLNENFGAIQTITTILLALFTGIYAFLTAKIVGSAHREHEASYRPYIQISVYLRAGFIFCLKIRNVGKTSARTVSLDLDKDIFQFTEINRNLKDFFIFKNVIESIPPETEYHIDLGTSFEYFNEENAEVLPKVFTMTISYSYFDKKHAVERTTIDLRPYHSTSVIKDPIIEELEKLKKDLSGKLENIAKNINSAIKR